MERQVTMMLMLKGNKLKQLTLIAISTQTHTHTQRVQTCNQCPRIRATTLRGAPNRHWWQEREAKPCSVLWYPTTYVHYQCKRTVFYCVCHAKITSLAFLLFSLFPAWKTSIKKHQCRGSARSNGRERVWGACVVPSSLVQRRNGGIGEESWSGLAPHSGWAGHL